MARSKPLKIIVISRVLLGEGGLSRAPNYVNSLRVMDLARLVVGAHRKRCAEQLGQCRRGSCVDFSGTSGGGAVAGERPVKNRRYRSEASGLAVVYDGERVGGFVKRPLKREVLRYEFFHSISAEFT
ncbi:hypothetical protein F2Q70_00022489 [Brassica cretica]|uniref:Uncharacterized protein n=1 Tax=Brassica cretica TaxID=69181 RepID=A0A8S9H6X9_BRACR|nr:hypothetical protein F2Q70_00022489 [Brassica cretica]KAF2554721.1 hypothetical protein F2Q68_00016652 [Brassica cretica]